MGDTAFLGRPWLAGPAGASLRLIRDYGEIERLLATIDVERRLVEMTGPQSTRPKKSAAMSDPSRPTRFEGRQGTAAHEVRLWGHETDFLP
jgi:hypothetical protein